MPTMIDTLTTAAWNAASLSRRQTAQRLAHNAYYAASQADDAWHAALERQYGREANEARYDCRGIATPELLLLADTWRNKEQARRFACYLLAHAT